MKKYFLLLFLFAAGINRLSAQTGTTANDTARHDTDMIFLVPDQMPEFNGNLGEYLKRNIHYPAVERESGKQGRVYIEFVVEKNGSITNVRAVKEVAGAPGFTKEAIRVIAAMPNWKPGTMNGRPVRVHCVQPIKFALDDGLPKPEFTYGKQQPEEKFKRLERYDASASSPQFPGGDAALQAYVQANFHSDSSNTNRLNDVILVAFIVDTNGKICNVKMGGTYYYRLSAADSSAMRMIASMPAWKPGMKEGRPCAVEMLLRIPTVYSRYPHAPVIPVVRVESEQQPYSVTRLFCNKADFADGTVVDPFRHHVRAPEFRGDWDSLIAYVDSAFEAFNRRMGYTCTGTLEVSFVVDKKGRVVNVALQKGFPPEYAAFNEEAVRIFCTMPRWKPGHKLFRKRNVRMSVPLSPAHSL